MSAATHVICGPAGSGSTERLLQRYRTVAQSSLGAALWIAPTQRNLDALRPRLLGDSACLLAPNLLTFQDFAEEVIRVNDPQARPLSNLQRRLLLDDIVAELHANRKLSHFERVIDTRGFAEGAFALVAELKRNEIWPAAFARTAFRREGGSPVRRKDWQCVRLYARYQQRLIRHHLYDVEGRFWYARDLLARGQRRPFENVRAVFLAGFSSFTRTQHEIIAALANQIDEVWITSPDDPTDEREELFRGPRATLHRLPPALTVEVQSEEYDLPAGLAHIERQLFRPLRQVVRSADTEGVALIEAPGTVGEARQVARQVKALLLEGVPAADIVVSLRDVQPSADLLREVFTDYGIPHDVEGAEPLLRHPAVATLLRALRLPDDDWPFAGVTALLRSGYFRPDWPELDGDAALPQHAEALLRLLGEPRSRDAYLTAVDRWKLSPPSGLEDEEAEEPRRRRTHELACRCAVFLHRFFRTWDSAPSRAPLTEHAAWLRRFAADLGLTRTGDGEALQRFWDELEAWAGLDVRLKNGRPRDRTQFVRMLGALAAEAGLPRTPRGPGRVRVLSAELARGLEVPYLFVMGLGERSFPDLSAPDPLLGESERQSFRDAGLAFPGVEDRLPAEMLLFYQLITRARRRLTLSYPAVDERGQALLPSSFLAALLDCFEPGRIPTIQKHMLIEGYDRDPPYSPAEYRVQAAGALLLHQHESSSHTSPKRKRGKPSSLACASGLYGTIEPADVMEASGDLSANLHGAALLAQQRLSGREFTAYDGRLRHPAVLAELQKRCGPEKVFSPTSLETYVACPFRFFLENVLRLQPLEEPREEIEQTRRGAAFHRALSRLHQQLQSVGVHGPAEDVTEHLFQQLDGAIAEYIQRAPSPASKVLWTIEGKRLRRSAGRYLTHWQKFVAPWAEQKIKPRPHQFEAAFGLPPSSDGTSAPPLVLPGSVEVRIGGRIDRVDVAEIDGGFGFWIIDYKTGNPGHYTGGDLQAYRRLQLTLYALAVEEVLLKSLNARPLGLAYWLVTERGPKPVLPGSSKTQVASWLHDGRRWRQVREQLAEWVATLVSNIRQGNFPLRPRSEKCTETCDFAQVCRISQSRAAVEAKEECLPLPVVNE